MKTFKEVQEAVRDQQKFKSAKGDRVPDDNRMNIIRGQIHTFRQNFLNNMESQINETELQIKMANKATGANNTKLFDKTIKEIMSNKKDIIKDANVMISIAKNIKDQIMRELK